MASYQDTVKTRICILSDTHSALPRPTDHKHRAYRYPLPNADVLIHAGDLTLRGEVKEHESMIEVLKSSDAELKIVIGGNHDITLDELYMSELPDVKKTDKRSYLRHYRISSDEEIERVRDLYCGEEARENGIRYLEEGVQTFQLKNGAKFTVYTSPWTPIHGTLAWAYPETMDRFNPNPPVSRFQAPNPVPDFPGIDIMITHGPPHRIMDFSDRGMVYAGCKHLYRAVQRCKPRIHCFGHIHEGYGAERMSWRNETSRSIPISDRKMLAERSSYVDLSRDSRSPLRFGEETLFVNASIMDTNYSARNAPWVIDLDLPRNFDSLDEQGAQDELPEAGAMEVVQE
jgi:Icc-related predicted phosphoesterase